MENKKHIAFVGDSFCATYNMNTALVDINQGQTDSPAYPNIVANHFQCTVSPYGFGGKSWWYSWSKFWREWEHKLDQLEAIVFTHTSNDRINSAVSDEFPLMSNWSFGAPRGLAQVNEDYFKYIHDHHFSMWAQEQYFKMLKEKFDNIKTVHLHCFQFSTQNSHLLPGVVFNTPLMHVSIGEVRGSEKKIIKAMSDGRPNHLSPHNNQALADVIIQALTNYKPSQCQIPLAGFEQYNPNAANWPHGVYWTK